MSLSITRQQIIDRIFNDIQGELDAVNPFLPASILRALGVANGGRFFDVYKTLNDVQREAFVNTATQFIFVERHGLLKGIVVDTAASAKGYITVTGTVGGIIDIGDLFVSESGNEYIARTSAPIAAHVLNIVSLTRSGSVATAQTATEHNLAPNIQVTMAGAVQTEYNGLITILSVPTIDTFTYSVSGSPVTPATGTITASLNFASIYISAVETGMQSNLDVGALITTKTPIPNIDDNTYAQFGGISGGSDEETLDEYKRRVQEAYAYPVAHFNEADVIGLAKTITGITRVWPFRATPEAGEVEVYFVRDNDSNIIPSPAEISALRNLLLTIVPMDMQNSWLHVYAPTPILIAFVFTSLVPNSQAMRIAVEDNLRLYFKDQPNVSQNVSEDAYRSIIQQTINPETGQFVESFSLATPTGSINVPHGSLAVFDSITWSF